MLILYNIIKREETNMTKTQTLLRLSDKARKRLDQLKAVNNMDYSTIVEIILLKQKKLQLF